MYDYYYRASIGVIDWTLKRQVKVSSKLRDIRSFIEDKGDLLKPEIRDAIKQPLVTYQKKVSQTGVIRVQPSRLIICTRSFLPHEVYAAYRLKNLLEKKGFTISIEPLHEGPSQGDRLEKCDIAVAAAHIAARKGFWNEISSSGLLPVYVVESSHSNRFFSFDRDKISVVLLRGTAASKVVQMATNVLRGTTMMTIKWHEHSGVRSDLMYDAISVGFSCINGNMKDCMYGIYFDVPIINSTWKIAVTLSFYTYHSRLLMPTRYVIVNTGSIDIIYLREDLMPLRNVVKNIYSNTIKMYKRKRHADIIKQYFNIIRAERWEHIIGLFDLATSSLEILANEKMRDLSSNFIHASYINVKSYLRNLDRLATSNRFLLTYGI